MFHTLIDHCLVLPRGRSHTTRRCRGVTYPGSNITEYTPYTELIQDRHGRYADACPCKRKRDRCFIAEQPAPAPHLAHPKGCAALRIVLVTVPPASKICSEQVPYQSAQKKAEISRVQKLSIGSYKFSQLGGPRNLVSRRMRRVCSSLSPGHNQITSLFSSLLYYSRPRVE